MPDSAAPDPRLRVLVLGSGTSAGVPTLLCDCSVCTSTDPRDNRMRPSILVEYNGHSVLIDTTPDFRQQALRFGLRRIDAILFTHAHADHILGLDDIRPFNFRRKDPIPIYADEATLHSIRNVFPYAFQEAAAETPVPRLAAHTLDGDPFDLFGLRITPVRLLHGKCPIYGFRFGTPDFGVAYLTDHSEIPAESLALLDGLDLLFLDSLRHRPHPTHSTVERSLKYVEQIRPRKAVFTHIAHDLAHEQTESRFPEHVRLAYDGLELFVELPQPA